MQMQMVNRLPCHSQPPGHFSRHQNQVAGQALIVRSQVVQVFNMPAWDDQCVYRGLRINIPEGHDEIVFEDDLCRKLPPDDTAKRTGVLLHPFYILLVREVSFYLISSVGQLLSPNLCDRNPCPPTRQRVPARRNLTN